MSLPDIVAIGASAGGLEALEKLLLQLPPELRAAIVVVLHRPAERISYLREILARRVKMLGRCTRGGGAPEARHLLSRIT
jgi:two-component system chemotaxis response regulator CheB